MLKTVFLVVIILSYPSSSQSGWLALYPRVAPCLCYLLALSFSYAAIASLARVSTFE